eukprot:scaffold1537_cov162-Ochromonas_danica.AAC.17
MEKTVFEGKDITQWLQHFRLQSSKLSEVLQEMEVVDVSDLEHVYGNEEKLDQIRQRIEVIVVAVQAYTKILQQIKEERRRRAFDAQQRRRTLQQAISVDLAFLVDCTGSMGHFITAIRNNVVAFVKSIHKRYPTTMLRIAFVGYRDFCDEDHMVIHPFTANAEDIRNYLFTQRAMGGGDEAEDVLGGLEVANNNLDWLAETRILYHIGDAPGHGEEFHDSKVTDDHSKQFGLDDYRRVLHSLYDKKVKYFFGKIKDTTDIMISKFNELIGSKYILETPLRPTEMMNEIRRRTIWTTSHSLRQGAVFIGRAGLPGRASTAASAHPSSGPAAGETLLGGETGCLAETDLPPPPPSKRSVEWLEKILILRWRRSRLASKEKRQRVDEERRSSSSASSPYPINVIHFQLRVLMATSQKSKSANSVSGAQCSTAQHNINSSSNSSNSGNNSSSKCTRLPVGVLVRGNGFDPLQVLRAADKLLPSTYIMLFNQ